jgi:predicted metalloprotease
MRWQGMRRSDNVEDRRGIGGRQIAVGGGLGTIVIVLLFMLLGGNPDEVLQNVPAGAYETSAGSARPLSEKDKEMGDFVSVTLASIEDVWSEIFRQSGRQYQPPKLVLFSGQTSSACGFASAASGPFYCPGDSKVYLDLDFFEEILRRLNAPGDFALAYVIAHEVGHHVQNLLGISDRIIARQGRVSEVEFNRLMVRMELQADFLAGVWAHYARQVRDFLEEGDIEEGMNAASAVGDDRIQRQTQGYIVPDAFTHGTSEQRARWFTLGFRTGDINQGDTFNARVL